MPEKRKTLAEQAEELAVAGRDLRDELLRPFEWLAEKLVRWLSR